MRSEIMVLQVVGKFCSRIYFTQWSSYVSWGGWYLGVYHIIEKVVKTLFVGTPFAFEGRDGFHRNCFFLTFSQSLALLWKDIPYFFSFNGIALNNFHTFSKSYALLRPKNASRNSFLMCCKLKEQLFPNWTLYLT